MRAAHPDTDRGTPIDGRSRNGDRYGAGTPRQQRPSRRHLQRWEPPSGTKTTKIFIPLSGCFCAVFAVYFLYIQLFADINKAVFIKLKIRNCLYIQTICIFAASKYPNSIMILSLSIRTINGCALIVMFAPVLRFFWLLAMREPQNVRDLETETTPVYFSFKSLCYIPKTAGRTPRQGCYITRPAEKQPQN